MTAKNPSSTWYYNDWENDPALKSCSLAAQGLWMRLLCIAARSPEHGVVRIGDLTFSLPDGLAHIALAVGRPLEEIAPLIDELLSSGAASQDRNRHIVNRRMVRAAKVSAARAQSGKNGATVTNGKRWRKDVIGRQKVGKRVGKGVGKTSASSRLQDFDSESDSSLAVIESGAAREPARSGRSAAIEPGWQPSDSAIGQLRTSRPDLDDTTIARRTVEFHAWCAATAKTTFNPDATWLGFMVKTHAQPHPTSRRNANGSAPTVADGIAAAFARRSVPPRG